MKIKSNRKSGNNFIVHYFDGNFETFKLSQFHIAFNSLLELYPIGNNQFRYIPLMNIKSFGWMTD